MEEIKGLLLAAGVALTFTEIQEMTPPPEVNDRLVFKRSWGKNRVYKGTEESLLLPDKPIKIEQDDFGNKTPIFSSEQLENGNPEDYGYTKFKVLDLRVDQKFSTFSHWNDQQHNSGHENRKKRPVHKYYVKDRFKSTLQQLMRYTGNVPLRVLETVKTQLSSDVTSDDLWMEIRAILKAYHWSKYYNRIPTIIANLRLFQVPYIQAKYYDLILKDFEKLSKQWPVITIETEDGPVRIRNIYDRKYFPSLRYIALRLMGEYGIIYPYRIPLALVPKTVSVLDKIYDSLQHKKQDLEELLDLFD